MYGCGGLGALGGAERRARACLFVQTTQKARRFEREDNTRDPARANSDAGRRPIAVAANFSRAARNHFCASSDFLYLSKSVSNFVDYVVLGSANLSSHSTPVRTLHYATDRMSVDEVVFVREREAAADANPAKKPKTAPKPKLGGFKPKAKALKDQPHVALVAPHYGPSGQSMKRSYARLKILGLFPDKARAERAAKTYIALHGGEVESFGTGYPNLEGDTYDSSMQVLVKHAGEMMG